MLLTYHNNQVKIKWARVTNAIVMTTTVDLLLVHVNDTQRQSENFIIFSRKENLPTPCLDERGDSIWFIFSNSFAMVPIKNAVGSGLELDKSTVIFALTFRSYGSLDFDLGLLVVTASMLVQIEVLSISKIKMKSDLLDNSRFIACANSGENIRDAFPVFCFFSRFFPSPDSLDGRCLFRSLDISNFFKIFLAEFSQFSFPFKEIVELLD